MGKEEIAEVEEKKKPASKVGVFVMLVVMVVVSLIFYFIVGGGKGLQNTKNEASQKSGLFAPRVYEF